MAFGVSPNNIVALFAPILVNEDVIEVLNLVRDNDRHSGSVSVSVSVN